MQARPGSASHAGQRVPSLVGVRVAAGRRQTTTSVTRPRLAAEGRLAPPQRRVARQRRDFGAAPTPPKRPNRVPVHLRTSEESGRRPPSSLSPLHPITIAHIVLIDRRGGRPRSNENWRFRIRCTSSIPAIATEAFSNDLKPFMGAHCRLIARWSFSTMLLRYLQTRTSTLRQNWMPAPQSP